MSNDTYFALGAQYKGDDGIYACVSPGGVVSKTQTTITVGARFPSSNPYTGAWVGYIAIGY